MTKEKLKPCPFCGKPTSLEVMTKRFFDDAKYYQVVCSTIKHSLDVFDGCSCSGPLGLTEQQAISAWNRRRGG